MALRVGVAEPVVGDADAAGESDLAVDDEQLAVSAMVGPRDRVPAQGVVPLDADAVALHEEGQVFGHLRGADGIQHDVDFHAGPRPFRQRLGEGAADFAIPVDVELEVDRSLRAADRGQHGRKDLHAVAQHVDAVAVRDGRAGERVHGLQKSHVAHAELMAHVIAHRDAPAHHRQRRPPRIARWFSAAEEQTHGVVRSASAGR